MDLGVLRTRVHKAERVSHGQFLGPVYRAEPFVLRVRWPGRAHGGAGAGRSRCTRGPRTGDVTWPPPTHRDVSGPTSASSELTRVHLSSKLGSRSPVEEANPCLSGSEISCRRWLWRWF